MKILKFLIACIVFLIIIFVNIYKIPSESMKQTLNVGDSYLAIPSKITGIKHGDVLIFEENNELLVKRCVAMSGDQIFMKNGILYLKPLSGINRYSNDHLIVIDGDIWVKSPYKNAYSSGVSIFDFKKIVIAEGELFMLGDNRDNSFDSREYGAIKESTVKDKALMIVASDTFTRIGNIL
jgi:signal peptidase I